MKGLFLVFMFMANAFAQPPSIIATPTPLSAAQTVQNQVIKSSTNQFKQEVTFYTHMYNLVFNNPDVADFPNACWVFSALGVYATQARGGYLAEASKLNTVVPGTLPAEPSGYTLTNNSDGTVTCVAPPVPTPTPTATGS